MTEILRTKFRLEEKGKPTGFYFPMCNIAGKIVRCIFDGINVSPDKVIIHNFQGGNEIVLFTSDIPFTINEFADFPLWMDINPALRIGCILESLHMGSVEVMATCVIHRKEDKVYQAPNYALTLTPQYPFSSP